MGYNCELVFIFPSVYLFRLYAAPFKILFVKSLNFLNVDTNSKAKNIQSGLPILSDIFLTLAPNRNSRYSDNISDFKTELN